VKPSPPHARSCAFSGTVEAIGEAEAWAAAQSESLGLGANAEFAINLCLQELFLNAVRHGHATRATIAIWAEADGARVEFIDDGGQFDPTVAPAKRIRGPGEDFEIGGYGIGLVQKFARRMSYSRGDGYNCLLLEFDADRNASTGSEALHAT
jgi:anti-sigma regulatory factor (Ser/Thr protein kinase)